MKTLGLRLWHSPTFMTWGSLAVRLSGVLLLLPIVLRTFSAPDVAVWQLFATLFTLTLLFDFGLSPTFSRLLAYARGGASVADMANMRKPSQFANTAKAADTDSATTARVFSTLMWLYPRIGSAIVVLLALLGTWALQRPISQTLASQTAWAAWGLVLVSTFFGFLGNAYSAALQGMNSIAPLRRWELATGLAQIATTLLALAIGGGLLAVVAVYQFWVVVNCFRNRQLLKTLHHHLFAAPATQDAQVMAVMWPATWRSGVGVLMSQGIIQSSGVIYSQLAPAAEVASYLLALRVITTISQFSQAPFYSKLPQLAELQAQHNTQAQLQAAARGMRLAHWVFVVGALAAAALVVPLLGLIGSRTQFVGQGVWAVMTLAFFFERYGAMHLQLYSLTNHIVWHIANGITGCIMIVLAATLYRHLGAMAFPLGMLIAYAGFYAIYSARKSVAALHIPFFKFEIPTSLAPACLLGLGLGASLVIAAQAHT
jgi:hypothetical protein